MSFHLPAGVRLGQLFILAPVFAFAGSDAGLRIGIAQTPSAVSAESPDELYRRREDLASARRAAEIWSANADTDFESAWKLARAAYWIGGHAPQSERRAAFERGISAGEAAVRLRSNRPEGHYWLAADMGALAESFGLTQGIKYRSRIKSELEQVLAIDAAFEQASAVTALGRWHYLVPRLFGGSRAKADEYYRRALDQFPHSVTALFFLAESQIAQHKTAEARQLLQRVVDAPIDAGWAPEIRDFKRKAAERLRDLDAAGREP